MEILLNLHLYGSTLESDLLTQEFSTPSSVCVEVDSEELDLL